LDDYRCRRGIGRRASDITVTQDSKGLVFHLYRAIKPFLLA